jgi:L-fucose isomerase-like protein
VPLACTPQLALADAERVGEPEHVGLHLGACGAPTVRYIRRA